MDRGLLMRDSEQLRDNNASDKRRGGEKKKLSLPDEPFEKLLNVWTSGERAKAYVSVETRSLCSCQVIDEKRCRT